MKKAILFGAAICMFSCVFGFTAFANMLSPEPYCVKMKNDKGQMIEITVTAKSSYDAKINAINMYPHLKFVIAVKGACN